MSHEEALALVRRLNYGDLIVLLDAATTEEQARRAIRVREGEERMRMTRFSESVRVSIREFR